MRRRSASWLVALAALALGSGATAAQQVTRSKQKDPGTPLDTIRNTHLFADVPEAKAFVRASRPPADTLQYQPITSQVTDVVRSKPRTPRELSDLEHQLEAARGRNERAAGAVARHGKSDD